jgi:hypothetical protein
MLAKNTDSCMSTLGAMIMLIHLVAAHDIHLERDDHVNTLIMDDVIWFTTIFLIAGALMWLCCFWDTPVISPPPTHCRECCRNDKVIHVRIEHCDPTKKDNSHFTRERNYQSEDLSE